VLQHDAVVITDDGALGTTSDDHVPSFSRYSPTDDGARSDPVVPRATHEPVVVQATVWRGTEIPMEGIPVTQTIATELVHPASSRAPTHATAIARHDARTLAGSRLMMSCCLSFRFDAKCSVDVTDTVRARRFPGFWSPPTLDP
jgi:hypothetical protein